MAWYKKGMANIPPNVSPMGQRVNASASTGSTTPSASSSTHNLPKGLLDLVDHLSSLNLPMKSEILPNGTKRLTIGHYTITECMCSHCDYCKEKRDTKRNTRRTDKQAMRTTAAVLNCASARGSESPGESLPPQEPEETDTDTSKNKKNCSKKRRLRRSKLRERLKAGAESNPAEDENMDTSAAGSQVLSEPNPNPSSLHSENTGTTTVPESGAESANLTEQLINSLSAEDQAVVSESEMCYLTSEDCHDIGRQPEPDRRVVSTEPPVTTVEQPVATTSTEQPVATTSTEQPVATTSIEQPVATTSTEQPVATTEQPVATTEQPVATTEQPVATIEQPVATIEQPVATTEQPVATTEQPVATTEQPVASIERHNQHIHTPPPETDGEKMSTGSTVIDCAVAPTISVHPPNENDSDSDLEIIFESTPRPRPVCTEARIITKSDLN